MRNIIKFSVLRLICQNTKYRLMKIEIISLFLRKLRKTEFKMLFCYYFLIEKRLRLLKCQGIQFNYVKHNINRKKNNLRTSVATYKPVFHLDLQSRKC